MSHPTSLLELPNELLLLIGANLEKSSDISSLTRVNRRFAGLRASLLHKHAIKDRCGLPALHWAASKGYEGLARLLINKGFNVNLVLEGSRRRKYPYCSATVNPTALFHAVDSSSEAVVRLLLESGADANLQDKEYLQTPIYRAAVKPESTAIVRLLLEMRADTSLCDCKGRTVLYYVALRRSPWCNLENISLLLESGASPNVRETTRTGMTILHHMAARFNLKETVLRLLLKTGDINIRDGRGCTPLYYASECNMWYNARLLIQYGADLDVKGGEHGQTALHRAVKFEAKMIVKLLVEAGANHTIRDDSGRTALNPTMTRDLLFWAAEHGKVGVARRLLESGTDPSIRKDGRFLIHWTVLHNQLAVLDLLLEKGAGINTRTETGRTALHIAAAFAQEEMVKFLLEKGADADVMDNYGRMASDEIPLANPTPSQREVGRLLKEASNASTHQKTVRRSLHVYSLPPTPTHRSLLLSIPSVQPHSWVLPTYRNYATYRGNIIPPFPHLG